MKTLITTTTIVRLLDEVGIEGSFLSLVKVIYQNIPLNAGNLDTFS